MANDYECEHVNCLCPPSAQQPDGGAEEWGALLRYTTDDLDIDPECLELTIFPGGNGDWYVSVTPQGINPVRGVRIATSGTRVDGLAVAIANAYRALRANGRRAVIPAPNRRAPIPPASPEREAENAIDWLDQLVRDGIGVVEFCLTENGLIGIWVGSRSEEERALATGDTVSECIEAVVRKESADAR